MKGKKKMKNKNTKILIIALVIATMLCAAFAVMTSANGTETKPEIISKNMLYSDRYSIMYAVAAETVVEAPVTLNVYREYPTSNSTPVDTYTATIPQNEQIGGETRSVYVFTGFGIGAQDFADKIYAQAIDKAGNKSDVVEYSVVEYFLERLYGGYDITTVQKNLYEAGLIFGAAAQDRYAADDAIRVNDYKYVRVVGGTVNGVEKGMFVNGETVTLSANAKGWQATVNGKTEKLNGTSYVVEGNALIETYNRPLDLTNSYYTTQGAFGEKTFDYTGVSYWKYSTQNANATLKFLTISDGMGDTEIHTHAFVTNLTDGNAVYKIGKTTGSAGVAQSQFANINYTDKNCFVFESDIMFNIANSGAVVESGNVDKNNCIYISRITVLDNPTNERDQTKYNPLMPRNENGDATYFEISGEYDFEKTTWKSFGIGGKTIENRKWYKMTIEYYKAEGVMKLYLDGEVVSTREGLATDFDPTAGLIQLQGLAYGSCVYVDNTYVGTVDKALED